MSGARLDIDGLGKHFRGLRAVHDVSFTVPAGAGKIEIASFSSVPTEIEPASRDVRRLGVPVNRKRVLRVMRERKLIQRRRPLERRKLAAQIVNWEITHEHAFASACTRRTSREEMG